MPSRNTTAASPGEIRGIGSAHRLSVDDLKLAVAKNASDREESAGERWYVVHTQPHGEARALDNLERQDFHTFCPCMRKTVRHARKTARKLAPLFPNYVFVRLDVSRDHWRRINGTRGVIRILTQDERPIAVPPGIVEALRCRTREDGAIDWSVLLKVGQNVRICDGPFVEFVGRLEHLDDSGRVRVLLDLMGRAVSIVARSEMLAPLG